MPIMKGSSWTRSALLCALTACALTTHAAWAGAAPDCSSGRSKHGVLTHLKVVGLTEDGRLVCFDDRRPQRARDIGHVSGLSGADTRLVGIDFRVQDGLLYGVGNGGGIYALDTRSAAATLVNRLSVPLVGNRFGVDFNPAADRLRIVGDTGKHYRHNVNAGGVTIAEDADLNYMPGTPAAGIVAAAYTNNDLSASTATTLFDLDSTLDQIAIQSPPNNGSLVATGKLTTDVADAGFDLYSTLRDGVTAFNSGFATLKLEQGWCFYRIVPDTGKAVFVGSFRDAVIDIALPLNQ